MGLSQRPNRLLAAIIVLGWSGMSAVASAQDSDDFVWSITPYAWAMNTSLDILVNDSGIGGGTNIAFKDALDVVDAAIQLHIEVGRGNWSGFGDLTYAETSDTAERPLLVVDIRNKQTMLDVAIAFWPQGVGSRLNLFGGLRYTGSDNRFTFTIDPLPGEERRSSSDFYDALLGMRYHFDLSERWGLLTRGDFSFGDSEGSWLVQGLFAYTVGKREQNRVLFGYQYKEAEFEDDGITTKFAFSGPMAGFNFRF